MTITPAHWTTSHWVIYNPEDDQCLCISDIDNTQLLWEKSPFTRYIILTTENIEKIEKFQSMLVTTEVDAPSHKILPLDKLLINFLTKKFMWRRVIFVPIVGKQYHGHTSCEELPKHLDFVGGIRLT